MFSSIRSAAIAVIVFVTAPSLAADETTPPGEFVVTHHKVDTGDRIIPYTVHAGMLPLYDNETGDLMARMFIMAYVADRRRGEPPRPVTFLWNGGPGASSSQVHLVGFGPKGLDTPETYPEWLENPPTEIIDRPNTWLVDSDLVFVDPIGTGYSRATSKEYRDFLYTTWGDIEAIAEMIRLYRTRFDAWDQPIFLAGESYGTTRAMGVADALERRHTGISGVILISGGYDAGQKVQEALRTALQIPTYTTAAHYHERLPPDLQAMSRENVMKTAEEWARREYAPALERRENISSAERAAILDGIERYTGVDARFVNEESLALEGDTFSDRLLDEQNLELGRYDYRMVFPRRDLNAPWVPTRDPSLVPMRGLMATFPSAILYIRNALGYKSDLYYQGPFGGAFHPRPLENVLPNEAGHWGGIYTDWMSVKWDRGEALQRWREDASDEAPAKPETPPLQRAMEMNPDFLVWNIRGLYDGHGLCATLDEAVAQTPAHLRERVRNSCYAGGHMLYTETSVRHELKQDFSDFVRDALAVREGN